MSPPRTRDSPQRHHPAVGLDGLVPALIEIGDADPATYRVKVTAPGGESRVRVESYTDPTGTVNGSVRNPDPEPALS